MRGEIGLQVHLVEMRLELAAARTMPDDLKVADDPEDPEEPAEEELDFEDDDATDVDDLDAEAAG